MLWSGKACHPCILKINISINFIIENFSIPLNNVKPECQTSENYLTKNKSCLFGHHTLATLQASGADSKKQWSCIAANVTGIQALWFPIWVRLWEIHWPLWFSLVEVKSEALLTPKGGADASCGSSKSPCPRSAWRFKSHKPHPCPHHLMAINLSSHFMTNTDLCHSRPNMDLYLHCREHLARFNFFWWRCFSHDIKVL